MYDKGEMIKYVLPTGIKENNIIFRGVAKVNRSIRIISAMGQGAASGSKEKPW